MTNFGREYRLSAGPPGSPGAGFEIGMRSENSVAAPHISFFINKEDTETA